MHVISCPPPHTHTHTPSKWCILDMSFALTVFSANPNTHSPTHRHNRPVLSSDIYITVDQVFSSSMNISISNLQITQRFSICLIGRRLRFRKGRGGVVYFFCWFLWVVLCAVLGLACLCTVYEVILVMFYNKLLSVCDYVLYYCYTPGYIYNMLCVCVCVPIHRVMPSTGQTRHAK